MAKAILNKNSSIGGIIISNFKIILQNHSNKPAWYCHKKRHIEKCKKIETPEINPLMYNHLIFDKGAKKYMLETRLHFLKMVLGLLDIHI
jgi:hypothetical protein